MITSCKSRGFVVGLVVGTVLALSSVEPRAALAELTPQMSGTFRPEKTYDFAGFDQVSSFNGGLTLQIPLGIRYKSGAMDYGLTLSFNSAKWQYRRASIGCGSNCVQESRLSPRQNAGAGWSVSLGGLILPEPGSSMPWNPTGELIYFDALGGEHTLFPMLHQGDSDDTGDVGAAQKTVYTRDGSFTRVKKNLATNPTEVSVELPDGSRHLFNQQLNRGYFGATQPWLPARIENAFGDGISITYLMSDVPPHWEIVDDFGRMQVVEFSAEPGTDEMSKVVTRVRLLGIDEAPSVWTFGYGQKTLNRPWPNVGTPQQVLVPVLTTLTLPDQSTYSIAANDYDLRGNPHRIVLPTRGEIHYEWQSVILPPTVDPTQPCELQLDPYMDLGEPHENLGVRQRILYNQQMAKLDQTTSLVEVGRTQYCWTLPQLGGPGCYDDDMYEQLRQTTLDADGTRTESYFSVYNAHNALVRQPAWGTSLLEYGMPYTRDPARGDPFGDGLFLSTEVSQCNPPDPNLDPLAQCSVVPQNCGPVLRRTYVSYEQDIGLINPPLPVPRDDRAGSWSSQNRRLTAQRTVFLDDCTSGSEASCAWTKEAWSEFDRFGHFRVQEITSSFALGTRTERTEYNPGAPTAPAPWDLGDPWVLGTFSFRETEQASVVPCSGVPGSWGFPVTQSTREESCFDANTGFLKATRLRTAPTGGVSSVDLVHRFVETITPADGLPELEAWYGGDSGGAPTGDLCQDGTFAGVPTAFAQSHEYENGILTKTRWLDENGNPLPFYSLRQEIDLATGLVKKIHDPADLGDSLFTEQGYDVMLRLTSVKPSAASGLAWEYFDHINAAGSSFAAVRHFACANGTDCRTAGTPLLQREWEFDGFGRTHLEYQRASIDPEKWDRRVTWYDGEGRKTFASEWTGPSDVDWADYGTKFEYDFAGRLKRTSHELHLVYDLDPVTWTYTGAREVERKVNVGTAIAGNSVTQHEVTTRETYDGFGRLVKVEEASGDGLSTLVPTSYHYDIGSRLIGSMTEPLDATPKQQRCWSYDPRGLLTSERHPELGASGQGTTTYSQYDALGNARQKTTGSRIASFVFDRANRLQTVSEGPLEEPTRTLKAFTYADTNEAGNWRLGKVQTADSWNYLPRAGTSDARARLEERFEYRGPGGAKSKRRLQLFNPDALSSVFHTSLTSLHAFSHEESFDPLGQRLQLTYPTCVSGTLRCTTGTTPSRTVASTYELGRLQNVAGWTLAGSAGVTYHPGGMWAEIRHTNGITDRQGRDPGFRPRPGWLETRQLGQVLWKPGTFSYDAAGNILTIGASEGGGTDRFSYDGVSRLKQARMYVPQREPESLSLLRDGFETGDHSRWAPHAGESIPNYEIEVLLDYSFDEHGNLLSWSKGGVSRPQPTDGATNHLTRGTFDAAGNLTILDDPGVQGDRVTFSFDALNRIVARQGESDAKPLYFLYTADDERALILDPDAQRSEWYRYSLRDFGGRLVRMVTEVNPTEIAPEPIFAAEQDVIFRGGAPLAFVASNSSTGLHLSLDHLGSIRLGTASEGQVLGWRKFYPFGEQATYPPDQPPLTLMFTGHERQSFHALTADEDLDYLHARFASPMTGRFLSVDTGAPTPGRSQTWNRYSYTAGNPMTRIDPDGRNWFLVNDRWYWRNGRSAAFTINGRKQIVSSPYTHLLVARATGTNRSGGTNFQLTLFNQKQVVMTGAAFSGGGGHPRIPSGNYKIRGDIKDSVGPNRINPDSSLANPDPFYGMQNIRDEPLLNPADGLYYDAHAAYGNRRAYLNPWAGESAPKLARGNYIHGQSPEAPGAGTTHGCLCYGEDQSIIDYAWDLGQKVPVAIDVPVEEVP